MKNIFIFLFSLVGIYSAIGAKVLHGHVADSGGEALPFVNVYIENSSIGTTTNKDGNFQLKCPSTIEGNTLVFQFVGFRSERILLNEGHFEEGLNIILQEESYQFSDIVLIEGENPADKIIRNVIENKDNINDHLLSYSNRAYLKSVMKLDSIPEKLPFFLPQDEPIDSSELGILYLSEALSDYHWQKPDEYKEKMIASKVSGQSTGISFNRVSDMDINFYDNYIEIGGISQRPFISPISNKAFGYYRYKLEGVFYESGKLINKIKVEPKRKIDPCFTGYIFVVEDDWVLHSIDLNLMKPVPMEFADYIHFDQQYISQDGFWLLFSNNLQIEFSLFGFTINYDVVNFYSNYTLNTDYNNSFFGNEVFSAGEDVTEKDSAFWNQIRPLALTPIEVSDYLEKDSIERYHKSDVYLDSMDRRYAKIDVMDVLYDGVSFRKRKKYRTIEIDGLFKNLYFNPIEGLRWESKVSYIKKYDFDLSRKLYQADGVIAYGLSDKKIKGKLDFTYVPDRIKPVRFGLSIFSDLTTFNDQEPISPMLSSYFSLMEKKHYRKVYQRDGISLSYRDNPLHGLYFKGKLSFLQRSNVLNSTNYSWKFKGQDYAVNNVAPWEDNTQIAVDVKLVYRHNQKYESNPRYGKIILSNPNPDLYLRFKSGIGMGTDGSDYSLLQLGVSEEMNLRLLGKTAWDIKGSTFLSKNNLQLMDKVFFLGNETMLLRSDDRGTYSGSILQSFHLLPFHSSATDKAFIEGHVSHHFNGFVLNKVPFLRTLKWQLVAGADGLLEEGEKPYTEGYIGIENIFKFLRVDWAVELGENFKTNHSLLFGLKLNLL